MTFAITNPAPNELTLSTDHGSIPAGGTVTVTVTGSATPPSAFKADLTISPGGLTVTVTYPPAG